MSWENLANGQPVAQLPSLTGRSAEDIRDHLAQLSSLGVLELDAEDWVSVPWDES